MTHKQTDNINGTHLQGHVTTSYRALVQAFGPHHHTGDDYKIDAEWGLVFDDGTVATIYNWKNGQNYNDETWPAIEQITQWNIGGHTPMAVTKVLEALK